jgi:PadR family transcriptional regulator
LYKSTVPHIQHPSDFELFVMLAVAALPAEDAYGMSIQRHIEVHTRRPVSIGAVYATVERLADKGYLELSTSEPIPSRGGRARKLASLTRSGRQAVRESVRVVGRMLAAANLLPAK